MRHYLLVVILDIVKLKKVWIEMERKVKNGEIDLQKDFRNYPREGTTEYRDKLKEKYFKTT
jgi:hypothetical protein